MKKILFGFVATWLSFSSAQAVSVWELSRKCGADGKTYCPKAGYGEPMKTCLNVNFTKLTPACKAVMKRINGGEKVKLF
jgi:hypothetical protein